MQCSVVWMIFRWFEESLFDSLGLKSSKTKFWIHTSKGWESLSASIRVNRCWTHQRQHVRYLVQPRKVSDCLSLQLACIHVTTALPLPPNFLEGYALSCSSLQLHSNGKNKKSDVLESTLCDAVPTLCKFIWHKIAVSFTCHASIKMRQKAVFEVYDHVVLHVVTNLQGNSCPLIPNASGWPTIGRLCVLLFVKLCCCLMVAVCVRQD